MTKTSLVAIVRHELEHARSAPSGRSATSVYSGHERVLRQTVIALCAGRRLEEHENPGEATIFVLQGRVTLSAGEVSWSGRTGDFLVIPEARHAIEAVEDSAILLTVAKLP